MRYSVTYAYPTRRPMQRPLGKLEASRSAQFDIGILTAELSTKQTLAAAAAAAAARRDGNLAFQCGFGGACDAARPEEREDLSHSSVCGTPGRNRLLTPRLLVFWPKVKVIETPDS